MSRLLAKPVLARLHTQRVIFALLRSVYRDCIFHTDWSCEELIYLFQHSTRIQRKIHVCEWYLSFY
jgi:hypothetical protein